MVGEEEPAEEDSHVNSGSRPTRVCLPTCVPMPHFVSCGSHHGRINLAT